MSGRISYRKLAKDCALIASKKKAKKVMVLDVRRFGVS